MAKEKKVEFYIKCKYFSEIQASQFAAVASDEVTVYGFDGETWPGYPFDGEAIVLDENRAIVQKGDVFKIDDKECYLLVHFCEAASEEIFKRKKEKGEKVGVFIWSCQDQIRFDASIDKLVSEENIKRLGLEHF